MRAMTVWTCRGVESGLSRARAQPELHVAGLHRRGTQSAVRYGMSSLATPNPPIIARRTLRSFAAVQEAPQELSPPMVTIKIPYRVNFGETLRVVGSSSLLGDWSADRGLQLTWTEGDIWTAEVPMRAGHYEFKCVVYDQTNSQVTRWEDGGNRILNITEEPGAWDVMCQWGATADMTQAFMPAPPPPAPPVLESEESVADVAPSSGEEAGAPSEELQTFLVLSDGKGDESKAEEELAEKAATMVGAAAAAGALTSAAAEETVPEAAAASGGGGVVMLLLATCAAGAVAAAAFLAPGGLDKSVLSDKATEAVTATLQQSSVASAQVRAQMQSQLAALAGHMSAVQEQVAAVQPAVRAQMASMQGSMTDGLSALQPMVRDGVSYMQNQATALQSQATAAAADAVASTGELSSRIVVRQG